MSATDFKPEKRHKADVDEWKILRKLKLGPCRVCGGSEWQPDGKPHAFHARRWVRTELHHLVGRDLGGDDMPDNLVPLDSECHRLVEERSPVACSQLRKSLTLKEYAYIIDKKGPDWMARYYPRRSAEDVAA